jgi:hypothetical protein
MRKKSLLAVSVCTAALAGASASAAFAGEFTGNGTDKGVNGNSPCSFSGQEDLQYLPGGSKGDPAHSQNWGHTKQDFGLTGGANYVVGWVVSPFGCNARDFGMKP